MLKDRRDSKIPLRVVKLVKNITIPGEHPVRASDTELVCLAKADEGRDEDAIRQRS